MGADAEWRAPAAARDAHRRLKAWLLEAALPLWWERGADRAAGGFFDRLGFDGRPAPGPKRVRVQARQAFAYAQAAELGWQGPAEEAHRHGIAAMRALRRDDGLYRAHPDAPGALDGMGLLYDQAFVLLALAWARSAFADAEAEPEALRLERRLGAFAHLGGGYAEAPGLAEPLFANPNMHLYEAFQAWAALSDRPVWRERAALQRALALERLIQADAGVLGEQFAAEWARPQRTHERVVWPGHLYEWTFLLLEHERAMSAPALRLIETAESAGVDPASGVVLFALDEALSPIDRGGRLWAQTERLRACATAAAITGEAGLWDAAVKSAGVVERFLETPTRGLWRDRVEADGRFREEPAPASTLYHIIGAIAGLERALDRDARTPSQPEG